jgi:hypothetical protein
MGRHIISVKALEHFTAVIDMAGEYGSGRSKSLKMQFNPVMDESPSYHVISHHKLVKRFSTLEKAIELYNTL